MRWEAKVKLEELLPLKVYPFTLSHKIGSSLKNGGKYDAVRIHFNSSINVHVGRTQSKPSVLMRGSNIYFMICCIMIRKYG